MSILKRRDDGSSSNRSSATHDDEFDVEEDFSNKAPLLSDTPAPSRSRRRRRVLAWFKSRPRVLLRACRRQPKSLFRFVLKITLLSIAFLLVVTPILFPSYTRYPAHYKELRSRCSGTGGKSGCANPRKEQVFISVSLFDPKGTIANGSWGEYLLELIHLIGEDNVFLSIYENDSGDAGAEALEGLRKRVPCKNSIVDEEHVDYEEFPHITMPDGAQRLKRLAYLSEMRNRALYPIDKYTPEEGIIEYDKILFLNDALFQPLDAAHLLFSTNLGEDGKTHYLSACSLDYDKDPFLLYDLYAQRDLEGFSNGIPLFPYFTSAGQGISRANILAQTDAVPVKSCWAGMVAMQARWVQNLNNTLPSKDWQTIGHHVIDPNNPHNVTAPVRFRYEPELFMDACECCLFLADVSTVAENAQEADTSVFVNPYVRVLYDEGTFKWEKFFRRWERLLVVPQTIITYLIKFPTHNPHRLVQEGERFGEEIYTAKDGWKMVERTGRNGMFCGVREMQLIVEGPRIPGKTNWEDWMDIPWKSQQLYFPH
jgi:hypothetical protein